MSADTELLQMLRAVANGSAQLKAFEQSFRELNTTLVELLSAKESTEAQDVAQAVLEGMRGLQLPAPVVNMPEMSQAPISISPQLVTPHGAQWSVDAERTPKGFRMTVTKL